MTADSTLQYTDADIAEALAKCAGNKTRTADLLGLNRASFRRRLDRMDVAGETGASERLKAQRGLLGFDPVLPGYMIKSTTVVENEDGDITRRFIKQVREPGDKFEVPAGQIVKGVSAYTDAQGNVISQWVKTGHGTDPIDLTDAIKAELEDYVAPLIPRPLVGDDSLAAVYVLPDLHLGMMSWGRETGVNWDLPIAQREITAALGRLFASTPAASQAVILVLGDFLHSDGYAPMTPASKNVLDVDGRYPKVLRAGTRMLIDTVSLALQKHQSVEVRILPGNHDPQSAISLSLALSMFFSSNDRVHIDDDPSYFWWWSWGVTLIGATHGDGAKMKDLPILMASQRPEEWGRSRYRVIYTGHIHHQSMVEISGVRVESFQAPPPPDAWHHKNGYGAGRSLTAIMFDREEGEVGRNRVSMTIPMPRAA